MSETPTLEKCLPDISGETGGKNSYALELENYYTKKYNKNVSPIAILKTLAVISSEFTENNKLWILHVAPSRHLKTKTSEEQNKIFTKQKLQPIGSDFTIHSLQREFGNSFNNKCVIINDMTLLLGSKAPRTRSRLIDAFSELASEGEYHYGDFNNDFTIKARFSLISNITPTSYLRNQKLLLGNTFTERCLVVYHQLTIEDMDDANLNRTTKNVLKIERFKNTKPKICDKDVKVTRQDIIKFNEYARHWRIFGAYTSSSSLFDMIKSTAISYAILCRHSSIGKSEYRFLDLLQPHICSPFESQKLRILMLHTQGYSLKEICEEMGKVYEKYQPFVSRTLNYYRLSGVI